MTISTTLTEHVLNKLEGAKRTTGALAAASTAVKNEALRNMAAALWEQRAGIIEANAADVADAQAAGQLQARIDRLLLNETRILQMMEGLEQVAELADPVGEVLDKNVLQNGLEITKLRVPMGVIAMIYESRPNVTVDATGLLIKTGNAIVLRGGREALRSNQALVAALRTGMQNAGLPIEAIQLIEMVDHASVDVLLEARGLVDLVIPRGGAGLIQRVVQNAKVPVIETGVGNCHVYVDKEADLAKAQPIVINAKTQRPSVCNAIETLLVHASVAANWLPQVARDLLARGVELRACAQSLAILKGANLAWQSGELLPATEEDWATEYLDFTLAVKVVGSLEEAMAHIAQYGSLHSEAIVTEDADAAETFLNGVDAAVVYHNASTRFTDGFEFGYGAEIGISTQKLHARGPMGLREMTSYKYVVRGEGQVRD